MLESDLLFRREARTQFAALSEKLYSVFASGGTLFVCGNGGSCADAAHIAAELCKSFERRRTLPQSLTDKLMALPYGSRLAGVLERGLPAIPLGYNPALKSAFENDCETPRAAYAQELLALAKPADMLLAISTSGNAENCLYALTTARALGLATALLTGPAPGWCAECADIVVRAQGATTADIQQSHVVLYHQLCREVEARMFG